MSKKRIHALLLCLLMLCSTLLMCACKDEPDPTDPSGSGDAANATYKVTVVDGAGTPYTEKVIVKFMQGDTQVAMVPISDQGVAEKELAKGDYTVEVTSTDSDTSFYYDTAAAKLTAEQTELVVVLANEVGENFETLYANSVTTGENMPYDAYHVVPGSTHVSLNADDRTYFLFVPTEAGTYEFSVTDDAATIGIYGASIHFIQSTSVEKVTDNKITISVNSSMIGTGETGTTVYVIGLDAAEGAEDCVLNIIRTGDAGWSFTEEPWSNYQPKVEITDYTMPEGITLKEFDLTAATGTYHLVLNEEDGCYHLNAADGPLVFVQLTDAMYGISMMNMVGEIVYQDGVLQQTGSAPFRYSYDNGQDDFFKEDYTDAMRQYVTCRDKQSGVYPLNEDLYYILPMGIEAMGWCREDTINYLFGEVTGVNPEYAWMFMLVHEDAPIPEYIPNEEQPTDPTDPQDPTETDPTETEPTETEPTETEPTEPQPTEPQPTEPQPTEPQPTEPQACDHDYGLTSESAATCTAKGRKTYTCSRCGDSYTEQTEMKDHDYLAASCTQAGICKDCGKSSGSALGHSYSDGLCVNCGVKDPDYVEETTPPPTVSDDCDHDFNVTSEEKPTCTEKGSKTYTCSRCDESYAQRVAANGHSYSDATCTKAATCQTCGKTNGSSLPHKYSAATCTKAAACQTCGKTNGSALGHNYSAATCTKPKTCETCGKTSGSTAAHSYNDATCTKPKTCKNCGKTNGNKLGHSYDMGECTRCGAADPNYKAPVEDNKDEPIVAVPEEVSTGTLEFEAAVKANHLVYYDIPRVDGTTLKINSKDAYVIYEGNTYKAENGVVTIPGLVCDNWNPVAVAIGNKGTSDATFTVQLSYPAGHPMKPISLKMGATTTNVQEGNELGVYYTWTATKTGTLTIKLDSVSGGHDASIVVTQVIGGVPTQFTLEEAGGDTLTIEVEAGNQIQVIINTVPERHKYPAATIKTTASIN